MIKSKNIIAANSNEETAIEYKRAVGDDFFQTDLNENYISEIESSALNTILERSREIRQEKLEARNDNLPDIDGDDDNTPPPANAIALPVPEDEEEQQVKAIAVINNAVPAIPTDPAELYDFINVGQKAVEAARIMMNSQKITAQTYNFLHKNTKIMAEDLLDAALKLATEINNIESKQGCHNLSGVGTSRSKEQILEQDFNMTPKQAWRICKLTDEAVRKEKEDAKNNETIPTISHALTYVEAKERQLKNAKKKQALTDAMMSNEKKTLPGGKHDVVLADFKVTSCDFDICEASPNDAIAFIICEKADLASAIKHMEEQGFVYTDNAVIIKNKIMAGESKCFQNYHKLIIVGIKGKYSSPYIFKGKSVIHEIDMVGEDEVEYVREIIEKMYPDGSYLDLISSTSSNKKWDICSQESEVENA